ncbi:MAG: hypothetical protein KGR18_12200 [Acidobacteria bacterium]|nr:hypothetical protein [Acidobacteriota bacterium]
MKRPLRAATGVLAATVLLGGLAVSSADADGANAIWPTYGPTHVLNPSGGVTGSDGMRITFGGTQLQVQRQENADEPECSGEIYGSCRLPGTSDSSSMFTQIALAVGDETDGGTAFVAPSFVTEQENWDGEMVTYVKPQHADNVTVKPWTVSATASPTQITQVLTGEADGLTYTVVATVTYTSPDDRMKIDYQVVVPPGNTKPVRLYHLVDTYLGGSDQGPGFFTDPVACGAGESGAVVGVDRADLGVVEAFQYVSGEKWSGYMSGYYDDVVFGDNYKTDPDNLEEGPHVGPGWMNDLNNSIVTDPNNDNGIGISWNFGATAGTYSSSAKLIFSSTSVDPCADPDAVSPTNPDPTEIPDPIIEPTVPPDRPDVVDPDTGELVKPEELEYQQFLDSLQGPVGPVYTG